ncbi:predicted protein [Naegleria gruberi]|uniref:Phosphatidate cytidylyltransferase n=1 Tax=Naegleria gruberi TaxID=5762 RepID=D2VPG9_NAEGR|nr:uncharacterized protein NAEGRDRAFT_70855 [Naegleria gruberi]EFC41205.1 predicted protein [Naegleria gruberi]|eukprot:XP_002673949.1 predicted protein [Naegleria gruberi strain NEG-M]
MNLMNLIQRFIVAGVAIPIVIFCIKYHSLLILITTLLSIVGIFELHGITNRIVDLILPLSSNNNINNNNNNNDTTTNTSNNNNNNTTTTTTIKLSSIKEISTPHDLKILSNSSFYIDLILTLVLTFISYFYPNNLELLFSYVIFIYFSIFIIDMILFSSFGKSDEEHTRTFIKIFLRTFSVLYIGLGFSGALIMVKTHRLLLVITLFDNWSSDAFALAFGKSFGKYKLHQYLSPNKTIEGGIGAIFGSVLLSIILYFINYFIFDLHLFFEQSNITIASSNNCTYNCNSLYYYIIYGIILGILGIIGDLIESYLKRIAKVKDSGSFFGAHGGVLDRIDGLLFSFPIIYFIHLFVF